MVVVRPLDVRVLRGIAHLQHGHILSVVSLLHIHVVPFALKGQDYITVPKIQEGHIEEMLLVMRQGRVVERLSHINRYIMLIINYAYASYSVLDYMSLNHFTLSGRC